MKKFLPIIIFSLFVFGWYLIFYEPAHPTYVSVTPQTSNLTLTIQPDDGRNFLVTAIKNAKKEVFIEIYLLSDKEIIDSIETAHENGADVRIIIECHPFGGGKINDKTIGEFKAKNIETKCASDKFALTHEKAVVVDGASAFILSQNLTISSFDKNREYDVTDINKSDVEEVRNIFLSDWENKSFAPTLTNIIESPNNSRAGLTDLINSAKNSIDVEMEVIDDSAIANLLIEKAKTTNVRVVLPTEKQLPANKKWIEKLMGGGVSVKTLASPYMHAKMILIDLGKAYTGSINLTSASMDENRELGIIFSQSDLIQKLQATFEKDWSVGVELSNAVY